MGTVMFVIFATSEVGVKDLKKQGQAYLFYIPNTILLAHSKVFAV